MRLKCLSVYLSIHSIADQVGQGQVDSACCSSTASPTAEPTTAPTSAGWDCTSTASCSARCASGYKCCTSNNRCVLSANDCSNPPSECGSTCGGDFVCCPGMGNQCLRTDGSEECNTCTGKCRSCSKGVLFLSASRTSFPNPNP